MTQSKPITRFPQINHNKGSSMKASTMIAAAVLLLGSAAASADWIPCAREGEYCKFEGRREVAYGAGKQWVSRYHDGGVKCTVDKFGKDPAVGIVKSCRVKDEVVAQPGGKAQWNPCAKEDGFCRFSGRREVAYGARDKWVRKVFQDGAKCSSANFGGDPIPGVAKSCSVYSVPTAAPSPATVDSSWSRCAGEEQACRFAGTRRVAYGANGRYSYRQATDGVMCGNKVFGDPAPGTRKSCYLAP